MSEWDKLCDIFPDSIQEIWDGDSEGSKWLDDLRAVGDKLQERVILLESLKSMGVMLELLEENKQLKEKANHTDRWFNSYNELMERHEKLQKQNIMRGQLQVKAEDKLEAIRGIAVKGKEMQERNIETCIESNHPKMWLEEFKTLLSVYIEILEVLGE